MNIASILEVLTAAHLSNYVDVDPRLSVRGGIMLVAPPASLKSTILGQLEMFPNAKVLSDTNVRQMMTIRDDIANNLYTTIGLLEMGKLYQRQDTTSANVEGHIAAMVDEGFKHGANSDSRMVVRTAKCFVAAGMTPSLYRLRYPAWLDSGFARRFIWCHYVLKDRLMIMKAIHSWKPVEIIPNMVIFGLPKDQKIPYVLTDKQSGHIAKMLRFYTETETPFILLKKIACVLIWRHNSVTGTGGAAKAMEILNDFAESLTKTGAEMEI